MRGRGEEATDRRFQDPTDLSNFSSETSSSYEIAVPQPSNCRNNTLLPKRVVVYNKKRCNNIALYKYDNTAIVSETGSAVCPAAELFVLRLTLGFIRFMIVSSIVNQVPLDRGYRVPQVCRQVHAKASNSSRFSRCKIFKQGAIMASSDFKEDWVAYSEYNKVLRAWFVAFGFGVPATFLFNKDLVTYISPPKGQPHIFVVFLSGAGAQVLMAFINKIINWCAYYKEKTFPEKMPISFSQKVASCFSKASNWFLIDAVFDLITISCFTYSIVKLLLLITATPRNM